jgi:hypothetical protein
LSFLHANLREKKSVPLPDTICQCCSKGFQRRLRACEHPIAIGFTDSCGGCSPSQAAVRLPRRLFAFPGGCSPSQAAVRLPRRLHFIAEVDVAHFVQSAVATVFRAVTSLSRCSVRQSTLRWYRHNHRMRRPTPSEAVAGLLATNIDRRRECCGCGGMTP